MIDRHQAERLARALVDELVMTAEPPLLDVIRGVLFPDDPCHIFVTSGLSATLANSAPWRQLVWRALEVAEIAQEAEEEA